MQQSNGYIVGFAAAMTIVLGGLLSFAAVGLKDAQKKAVELDTRKQILGAVTDISSETPDRILEIFNTQIEGFVVNSKGEKIDGVDASKVDVGREFKKPVEERQLPVFKYTDTNGAASYILPMYGNGLWNNIWGFLALESDGNTVKGISMDHVGETPGLGARITSDEVQDRYTGKKIFEGTNLVSIQMLKGENNASLSNHQVDGMSGATLTADGVNDMLENYLSYYKAFLEKSVING
ncbi:MULTISPECIES: NADH:ubiquinone reductase (Na(+)-transporting) subunit C [Persicobacter]|uniref:Na(+)-translocating NADH-quinone reductase subunit C n=1 Tax=Persicobacter diffluens TaxID=981 RepID=A0AAN4VVU5_9BACT|nr:NADH:ubiquinone reductase (Na(+)-transporting) subunit C [Persicobacter sp. CCB-QB2]GJM59912.1 Na(+)-translocating NADH-quinone reductase subunit C [Persicobacter diffluens]